MINYRPELDLSRALSKMKSLSRQALKAFIFTFIFAYFGYHLISGQNGILNYFKEKAKLKNLENELTIVEEKTNRIQGKTHKLYPSSLDADLLDEQYRRSTGKIKANEKVYYYDN